MQKKFYAGLRILMGWNFLWGFFDKLFGLGFITKPEQAWLNGGSPTTGFLKFGTKGPFAEFFQSLAGQAWVDWFFMVSLLLLGVALILGIGMRLASYGGALLLLLMYIAGFIPPEHNPFLDEHLVYAFILLSLPLLQASHYLGLGGWWESTALVNKLRILK